MALTGAVCEVSVWSTVVGSLGVAIGGDRGLPSILEQVVAVADEITKQEYGKRPK